MLQDFLSWYHLFAKDNPIVASAFGVGFGGWALMMLRSTPAKVFGFIKGRLVTTMVMNSAGGNEANIIRFMIWFNKSKWGKYSRNFAIETRIHDPSQVDFISGFGFNFFIWQNRLFWFRKIKLDSSAAFVEKYEITLSMLGRKASVLKELVEQFRVKKDLSMLTIHQYQHGWSDQSVVRRRTKESVIIKDSASKQIFGKIDEFIGDKEWYHDRGLPYKLCFLFTGPPGSGKTSLSKAIGSTYNRDIFTMSLAGMTDAKLQKAVQSVPSGSIIQMEDFESSPATKSRSLKPLVASELETFNEYKDLFVFGLTADDLPSEHLQSIRHFVSDVTTLNIARYKESSDFYIYWNKHEDEPHIETVSSESLGSIEEWTAVNRAISLIAPLYNRSNASEATATTGLTLTGILNALDGLVPLDDQIVILTTNHPEVLDEAILRKGRIDHIVELGLLGDVEVRRYIKLMFPEAVVADSVEFNPIAGCNLQALFYENKFDSEEFIKSIPKT